MHRTIGQKLLQQRIFECVDKQVGKMGNTEMDCLEVTRL
jgi:hypothetical protein